MARNDSCAGMTLGMLVDDIRAPRVREAWWGVGEELRTADLQPAEGARGRGVATKVVLDGHSTVHKSPYFRMSLTCLVMNGVAS